MIDLQQFCGTGIMGTPFSKDGWTYATNGHMIVRVPRIEAHPEREDAPNGVRAFAGFLKGEFRPLKNTIPPRVPREPEDCIYCDGTGNVHPDCPDCKCKCEECDGTGNKIPRGSGQSVTINGKIYDADYTRQIVALPGFAISDQMGNGGKSLAFRFDGGGQGLLMPRTRKADDHLSIEL